MPFRVTDKEKHEQQTKSLSCPPISHSDSLPWPGCNPPALALSLAKPRFLPGRPVSAVSVLTPAQAFPHAHQNRKGRRAQVEPSRPHPERGRLQCSFPGWTPDQSRRRGCQPWIISGVTLPRSLPVQPNASSYAYRQPYRAATPDSFRTKIHQKLL